MTNEEKLAMIVLAYQCIYDNWVNGGTFGRLIEIIRERAGLQGVKGVWEDIQCAGTLSIHNYLPDLEE